MYAVGNELEVFFARQVCRKALPARSAVYEQMAAFSCHAAVHREMGFKVRAVGESRTCHRNVRVHRLKYYLGGRARRAHGCDDRLEIRLGRGKRLGGSLAGVERIRRVVHRELDQHGIGLCRNHLRLDEREPSSRVLAREARVHNSRLARPPRLERSGKAVHPPMAAHGERCAVADNLLPPASLEIFYKLGRGLREGSRQGKNRQHK